MREFVRGAFERLPLQYRVLCRQFLLRVVDLESLSIEADIPRYLGQFAGVLLMLSMIHAVVCYAAIARYTWAVEQYLVRTTMLVVGLITVVCWDSTFPDRRDVMVLGTLPVRPGTIVAAKVSATAGLIGLGVMALNVASGVMAPLCLGPVHRAWWGFFVEFAAYWVAMTAAALFLYGAVLAVQGGMAAVLPRGMFLRISAALQLAAFTVLLGVYFLEPSITSVAGLMDARNHAVLAWSPQFWFFAVLNQMDGSLPRELTWLAWRGWAAVAIAVGGGAAALMWSYLRTMKRTVEQPDLAPSARRSGWRWPLARGAHGAMVVFSVRTVVRSRHHRVAYAFYMSMVLAIGLSCLRSARASGAMSVGFLMGSVLMVALAVAGLRGIFSLPISLNANWVMRVTQRSGPEKYLAAARTVLLILAAAPAWICAAAAAIFYRQHAEAWRHLVLLGVMALLFVEASMVGMKKAPFACSYLPGRSNVQVRFWGFVIGFLPLAMVFARYEWRVLDHPLAYARLVSIVMTATLLLWLWNRRDAKSRALHFEDAEHALVTTLGIGSIRPVVVAAE